MRRMRVGYAFDNHTDEAEDEGHDADETTTYSGVAPSDVSGVPREGVVFPAEEELGESYRTLLQTVGDAVLIADVESSVFIYVNWAAVELLGYTQDELCAMHARVLHLPGHAEAADAIAHEVRATGSVRRSEVMLQRKDGSCFWAELRMGADWVNPARAADAAIIRDVTERVERDQSCAGLMPSSRQHTLKCCTTTSWWRSDRPPRARPTR